MTHSLREKIDLPGVELVELVATTNLNEVWRGVRRDDGAPVAVKLPVANQGPEALRQEAETVQDLIGSGCEALIPAQPPKEALKTRRERANQVMRGEYVHTIPNAGTGSKGYRPGRKTSQRRNR